MDPIANMFSQLKNAINANHKETVVTYSKLKMAILEILKKQGFVISFEEVKKDNQKYPAGIKVEIAYKGKEAVLNNIKRISRPGRRMYVGAGQIRSMRKGNSEILISTSEGIISGKDAHKKGLGGEVICEVS